MFSDSFFYRNVIMPTFYKNISGCKVGGQPEIIRITNECQLTDTNCYYIKENNSLPNYSRNLNDLPDTHNTYVSNVNDKLHNVLQFNPTEWKPNNNRIILNQHLSDYAIDRLTRDEKCLYQENNVHGFRYNLGECKIGGQPSYASYVNKCPPFHYKSVDFYPFLLNDDLLFTTPDGTPFVS